MSFEISEYLIKVDTARFGPFTFRVGADAASIEAPLLRAEDAYQRFRSSPLATVANQLEKEVVVSSVFGTNSIEGGTLSEQDTQFVLDLDPLKVQDVEQRRAVNIKAAYDLAQGAATRPGWRLDINFVQTVHAAITRDIPHEHNLPGMLRDNPKEITTRVGDAAHGGCYKPPQFGTDIRRLLECLLQWHEELIHRQVPVLIRAPLIHYYFELIHPFWDGNGRVGRVLEASLLLQAGYRYAPFRQARYYYDNIDRYFALFNRCRKAEARGQPHPTTEFLVFFLDGIRESLNSVHDRVNHLVDLLLFEAELKHRHDERRINARQYAIVSQVLNAGRPLPLTELRRAPWYLALYTQRTDKTKQRDLQRLREQELVFLDHQHRLWPGFMQPGAITEPNPNVNPPQPPLPERL